MQPLPQPDPPPGVSCTAVYREATHEKWKKHFGCWCACVYCDTQYKRVCGTWDGINTKNERQPSPCWHLIILCSFSPLLHSPLAFPLPTSPLYTSPTSVPLLSLSLSLPLSLYLSLTLLISFPLLFVPLLHLSSPSLSSVRLHTSQPSFSLLTPIILYFPLLPCLYSPGFPFPPFSILNISHLLLPVLPFPHFYKDLERTTLHFVILILEESTHSVSVHRRKHKV